MMFAPRVKGLGADSFLKLNDKEEVTGVFSGEIYTFKRHWVANRGSECIGEGCTICAADPEAFPSFRFRVNFVTTKDGQWVSKIFEGGGETYDLLVNHDKKFDLGKTIVDITRMGLKTNTKYNILPRLDQPISREMEAKIKSVTLLALVADKAS